jgi:hypothetical protein
MKDGAAFAIRFTADDTEILHRLEKLTGLAGPTAIMRMAIREALSVWERKQPKAKATEVRTR